MEPQKQQSEEEIYQPQYPYASSNSTQPEGQPRDEPPITYETASGPRKHQGTQVPWWARPQQQQHGTRTLVIAALITLFLMLLFGAMGIVGLLIGLASQLLGLIVGGITALFVFSLVLIFMLISIIGYALRRNSRRHPRA